MKITRVSPKGPLYRHRGENFQEKSHVDLNFQDLWHAFTFLTLNLPAGKEEQMRFGKALGAS